MSPQRLDRVLMPVLLVSAAGAVILGLVGIWSPADSELRTRLLHSSIVLALGSGFVLSATRLGGSGGRN